ncbi:hypothetical protein PS15m_005702 [Mucor circinelloides]
MMSNSSTNSSNPNPTKDVVPISGSLLEDVHIDYGQEEDEEDSVFDQNLLQYLDQLPIAAPPTDAKYSASFMDSVLSDIETFKQEARNLNYDNDEPCISSLLDFTPFNSEAYSVEQDTFSAVEQPRFYDNQQQQLYQEQEEIPIQFNMHQDDQSSVMHPDLSADRPTEYSDYLDLFNLGQDQPNEDVETDFFAQRKAELNALFDHNEDSSKDFLSWLCFSDDDASQVQPKDNVTTEAVNDEAAHTFSTEYPIENKNETKRPFSSEHPIEKSHIRSQSKPRAKPKNSTTTKPMYSKMSLDNREAENFLQKTRVAITHPELYPHDNYNKPFSSSQAKASSRKNTRRNSSVNISKADFMFVSSSPSSSSKYEGNLSDISEKSESVDSFIKFIVGTSTPVDKNKQKPGNIKRRATVLGEVDRNKGASSSTGSPHRYSTRARTSPSAIRKTYGTLNKTSRTFDFTTKKR